MFERFTDRARRVVVLAQEEARLLNHNYIGTEHLLLGLIHEGEGVAARVLVSLGASLEKVRFDVESVIGRGGDPQGGNIPFTPRAKKVMEYSLREAVQLQHRYIGTEHILLGMLREGEGVAAGVLTAMGLTLIEVRERVIQTLGAMAEGMHDVLEDLGGDQVEATVEAELTGDVARATSSEPLCPVCRARMLDTASYRILEAAEHGGEGHRRVLFLFCTACGTTIDDQILPEDA